MSAKKPLTALAFKFNHFSDYFSRFTFKSILDTKTAVIQTKTNYPRSPTKEQQQGQYHHYNSIKKNSDWSGQYKTFDAAHYATLPKVCDLLFDQDNARHPFSF